MKKNCLNLLLILALLSVGACEKSEDNSPCGDQVEDYQFRSEEDTRGLFLPNESIFVGKTRLEIQFFSHGGATWPSVLSYSFDADSVCPLEQINCSYDIDATETGKFDIEAIAWYYMREYIWPLKSRVLISPVLDTTYQFSADTSFSIKDAYKGAPGDFGLRVRLYFPYQGSARADSFYCNQYLNSVRIDWDYKKFKVSKPK
jgi:hypothetical protein